MRLSFSIGIVILAIILQANCQHDRFNRQQSNVNQAQSSFSVGPKKEYVELVAQSVTNLAQKISQAIASPKSKTEIFSPVSIAGALSLLLLGSGGQTRDELMALMGFNDRQIGFADIHKSFGKLFRDLVSNEPTEGVSVPWRENDKCNNYDYDDDDEPSPPSRGKRDTDPEVKIDIGNGIFALNGTEFDEKYQRLANELYKTETQYLDFQNHTSRAVATINEWVRKQTRGRIPEIVSHLDADTLLLIANTLYFKAEWEEPFLRDGTRQKPFFPDGPDRASVDVPMMVHGGCFPYFYWKEENVKVLGLPYKRNNTMYVFLPDNSNRQKVAALHKRVNATTLNSIIRKMEVKTASIQFPKMHLLNSFNLKQVLEQLGAYSIFSREKSDLYRVLSKTQRFGEDDTADDLLDILEDTAENAKLELKTADPKCVPYEKEFDRQTCERKDECRYGGEACFCCATKGAKSRAARQRRQSYEEPKKRDLYVNEVVHKVDVVVNEKGTEGGAVTATLLDRITPAINFRANGPFMMVIRDESTQLPLFFGSVYDPRS